MLSLALVPPARADQDSQRDAYHTWMARQALDRDSQLAPLNLGVKAANRVITLWGPIQDPALGARAVEVLRGVPEFRTIVNELYFEPDDLSQVIPLRPEFLPELVRLPRQPDRPSIALLPPLEIEGKKPRTGLSPGTLTTRPGDTKPLVVLVPEAIAKTSNVAAAEPLRETALLPPVPVKDTVLEALRAVQDSQPRFKTLVLELRDGVVTLRGSARQGEALHELARPVAAIPGVVRVLVKENERLP